jgi:hypothetical protein
MIHALRCSIINSLPWQKGTESVGQPAYAGGSGKVSKLSIVAEFWDFLKVRKKWWLAPIVIILVLLGALILLTEGSAVAPFIYTIF